MWLYARPPPAVLLVLLVLFVSLFLCLLGWLVGWLVGCFPQATPPAGEANVAVLGVPVGWRGAYSLRDTILSQLILYMLIPGLGQEDVHKCRGSEHFWHFLAYVGRRVDAPQLHTWIGDTEVRRSACENGGEAFFDGSNRGKFQQP